MESSIEQWKLARGEVSSPDDTMKSTSWHLKGGVAPWIEDVDLVQIDLSSRFNHKGAPHIVLFVVDDWGWNDVGYQSTYLKGTTPNIDKLAASGIKLTNYYTHELCTPSRAALMTGRYALRFGMHGVGMEDQELYLTEVTVAQELKTAGYRTNIVGKWHLGMSSFAMTPTHRGFDYFYGYLGGYINYWTKKYGTHTDLTENTELVGDPEVLSSSVFSEDLYIAAAERIIANHAKDYSNQPMFLYFASQLLHTPWAAPSRFTDQCNDGVATTTQLTYCAMNLMLDEVVGKLTCALEQAKMNDNTLFILVSDNGGNHLMDGNTYPMRGNKGSFYRGGDSVPAFIAGSANLIPKERAGGSYDGQVHVTDWLPTIMRLATDGEWAKGMRDQVIDGADQWTAITKDTATKHPEIVHYLDSHGNVSYQHSMMKLVKWDAEDLNVMLPIEPAHVFEVIAEPAVCLFSDDTVVGMQSSAYEVTSNTAESFAVYAQTVNTINTVSRAAGNNIFVSVFCVLAFLLVLYQLATFKSRPEGQRIGGYPLETGESDSYSYFKTRIEREEERAPLKNSSSMDF
eukprot:gene28548-35427_t